MAFNTFLLLFIAAGMLVVVYLLSNLRRGGKHSDKQLLYSIINKLDKMADEIQDLTAEVAETKGIMLSAKTLIEGFAAALEAAGTDKVKLKALRDDLNEGSEGLAAALAANPLPGEVVVDPPTP